MRTSLVAFVLALGLAGLPALAMAAPADFSVAAAADQQGQPAPPQSPSLNVDIDTDEGAWYTSPMWIAVGVLALILIIALIMMAGRGSTTVVK